MSKEQNAPSVTKNYFLYTSFQVLQLLVPLVVTPYVSRILGAEGLGLYSYTLSIVTYFSMFASLGTNTYAQREIAIARDDKTKLSRLFFEISLMSFISTVVCLCAWAVFIVLSSSYRNLYLALTICVASAFLDISWFYSGLEKFNYIVFLKAVIKFLSVIALFVFVKTSDDVVVYILIVQGVDVLAYICLWFFIPKFIVSVPLKSLNIAKHFKESLIYFVPTIALTIYAVLDKTLLGLITGDLKQNGYYDQAVRAITLGETFVFVGINSVMGSRMSYLYSRQAFDEVKIRIKQSINYSMFIAIGFGFGLCAVAKDFVNLFFGPGFEPVVNIIYVLSPIVAVISVSNCLGNQYYIPAGKRKISAVYLMIGAGLNLILNLIMIPIWQSVGAAIASVIAETVISVLFLLFCNGFFTVSELADRVWKKIICGLVMFTLLKVMSYHIASDIKRLLIEIPVGAMIYIGLTWLCRDSFFREIGNVFIAKLINKLRGKSVEES